MATGRRSSRTSGIRATAPTPGCSRATTGATWTAEYFLNGASQGQFALATSSPGSFGGIGFSRDWIATAGTGATLHSLVVESLFHRTISGTILADGTTPISGVSVDATGLGGSDTTDVNGDYSIVVPNGWSGDVIPSAAGELAYPSARSYATAPSRRRVCLVATGS